MPLPRTPAAAPPIVLTVALAIFLAAASSTSAAEEWLISSFTNSLYDYTQGEGDAYNRRTIDNVFGSITDIDFDAHGVLYGLSSVPGNTLYRIDPKSGDAEHVGLVGLPTVVEGDIGFDPTTNMLYAVHNARPSGNEMFVIDTVTGSSSLITHINADDPSGLAFDNAGNLWIVDTRINVGGPPVLLKVDKVTGAILLTRPMPFSFQQPLLGMDFNPLTNTLYMAAATGGFYRVTLATGDATLIDQHDVLNAAGLAYGPEPASLALAAFAALGFLAARRRTPAS